MKRLTAIALILVFFAGIPGFTSAAHYCGNEMVETQWMLGPGELGCGMDNMDDCPSAEQDRDIHPQDCCQNHYLTLEVSDAYDLAADVELPNLRFVAALAYTFAVVYFQNTRDAAKTFPQQPPSLPFLDLNILYGVLRL